MYCNNCGSQINDNAVICVNCGVATNNYHNTKNCTSNLDSGSAGWGFLGFFIPIVGLILYLVWKNERPKSSKSAGKGALISVITWIVFYFLIFLFAIMLG